MELNKAKELARQLMNQHGLGYWGLELRNYKTAFGKCNYRYKIISLSAILTPHCTDKAVRDTILHEIAHAKAGRAHGHDHVWRSICISIGGNGERTGGEDNYIDGSEGVKAVREAHYNYVGTCPNGHVSYRNRIPRGKISCGRCSRRFDERFLIVWKKNL